MTIELESRSGPRHGQDLLDDVVQLFVDLLMAGGATRPMIETAVSRARSNAIETSTSTIYTELGGLLRDCMEVMCTWRRDTSLINAEGLPAALALEDGPTSFDSLCRRAGCKNEPREILNALIDFGAVSVGSDRKVVSETPTFLLGRAATVGRLATDALLKHMEGYLRVVHRNVCSVSGPTKARFERACTVSVAVELEPVFDRLVRDRGQIFIDSIDEWLERNAKRESASGRYLELGAGAYFIDLGERSMRTCKG